MKKCTKCSLIKDESEFSNRGKVRNFKLQSWCKECSYKSSRVRAVATNRDKVYYWKNHEESLRKNKENWAKNGKQYCLNGRLKKKAIKKELVSSLGGRCSKCGYDRCLSALDFHHKDPNEKEFSISQALYKHQKTLEQLKEEVKKCVVLCKNCHTEEHEVTENLAENERQIKES